MARRNIARGGRSCRRANKVREGRPHIVDMIKNGEIDLIVNTTEGKQAIMESLSIRAEAVRRGVTYYTTLGAAVATCRQLSIWTTVTSIDCRICTTRWWHEQGANDGTWP